MFVKSAVMSWKFGFVSLIFGCMTSNPLVPVYFSSCGELIPSPSLN